MLEESKKVESLFYIFIISDEQEGSRIVSALYYGSRCDFALSLFRILYFVKRSCNALFFSLPAHLSRFGFFHFCRPFCPFSLLLAMICVILSSLFSPVFIWIVKRVHFN